MVYLIIKFSSLIFFKLYLGFKVYGKENIPKSDAFILAANHASYIDPLLLAASFRRPLHFMARERLLKAGLTGRLLRYANTISVKRHGMDMSAIKKSLAVLREGKILAVFPEGTRSKDRKLKMAKPGTGFIVSKTKVPVVPAYIEGSFDAQPRSLRTLNRHPVNIYIGRPVYFDEETIKTYGDSPYQGIGDEIMRRIAALKETCSKR